MLYLNIQGTFIYHKYWISKYLAVIKYFDISYLKKKTSQQSPRSTDVKFKGTHSVMASVARYVSLLRV